MHATHEDLAELEVHTPTYGDPSDTVVAAVADDEFAGAVVDTAGKLASRLGLGLTLVHSADADIYLVPETYRATIDRGHALLDRVAARWPTADRVVQTGDPAAVVNAAAENAAFIVVGSHGFGPLTAALRGSVSAEIAREAPRPVLIVGPRATSPDSKHRSDDGAA